MKADPVATVSRLRRNTDLAVAFAIVCIIFCVAAGIASSAIDNGSAGTPPSMRGHTREYLPTFLSVLSHNIPAAMLMFSGLVTCGLSTLIGTTLVGSFVGATTAASTTAVGSWATIASVVPYAPFELMGFLIAATAGILPVVHALRALLPSRDRSRGRPVAAYAACLRRSLVVFGIALVILILAAGIEAGVIVIRGVGLI